MNVPENVKMYKYKYRPKDVVLTINGENFEFKDGSVSYINFHHDYMKTHLPVIQMGLLMEVKLIRKFYDSKELVNLTFTINEEKYEEEEEGDSTKLKLLETVEYMKHTFVVVQAFERTTYITADEDDNTDVDQGEVTLDQKMEEMRKLQNFEMYLVDLESVNWFDQEYSDHLVDVSYEGMLQKLFMVREIPPDLGYATPPLQTGKLKDVSIPLGDLVSNVDHYNQKYGIYDCDPIIYYDLEYFYCISKTNPNIVAPSATDFGTICFTLYNPDKPEIRISGSYDDAENETHWVNLQTEPNIDDTRVRDVNAKMSTLASINAKGIVNKTTLDEEATRMQYIFAHHKYSEKQVLNENMTHGPAVHMTFENISVKFIRPYKNFKFETDTSYQSLDLMGHIFRILSWNMSIQREGFDDYITDVMMTLYNPDWESEK